MLEVTVIRKSQSQSFQYTVKISGFDRLTPRAARAALEIAFGQPYDGTVWQGRAGYRVYKNTARKVFAD